MAESEKLDDVTSAWAATLAADARFKAVLRALKAETLKDWANSGSGAGARREELYRDIQAVGRLEARIDALAADVRFAERKAEQDRTRKQLKYGRPN